LKLSVLALILLPEPQMNAPGPEPRYKGKPLSDWAKSTPSSFNGRPTDSALEAMEAVRAIGSGMGANRCKSFGVTSVFARSDKGKKQIDAKKDHNQGDVWVQTVIVANDGEHLIVRNHGSPIFLQVPDPAIAVWCI